MGFSHPIQISTSLHHHPPTAAARPPPIYRRPPVAQVTSSCHSPQDSSSSARHASSRRRAEPPAAAALSVAAAPSHPQLHQRKRLQLARLLAIDRPIWLLDEPSVALDDEGVKLLEYIIKEHRKKGWIVIVATHLPIAMEDAMVLRLPPRFLRRMTLVDMLDHGGLD